MLVEPRLAWRQDSWSGCCRTRACGADQIRSGNTVITARDEDADNSFCDVRLRFDTSSPMLQKPNPANNNINAPRWPEAVILPVCLSGEDATAEQQQQQQQRVSIL